VNDIWQFVCKLLVSFAIATTAVHGTHTHHHPRPPRSYVEAVASYYGPSSSGGGLACGGYHDQATGGLVPVDLTDETIGVANKTLPCGQGLWVCAARCAHVAVVDRGPYVAGRDYDLTEATARLIGFDFSAGVATIKVHVGN
jgi:rare lipoprotein A